MTVIEALDWRVVKIPLRKPVIFASGELREAAHILLRVRDSDGAVGQAEVIPRPMIYGDTVRSALAVLEDEVRPLVVGRPAGSPAAVMDALRKLAGNYVIKGALDMALHDLLCRRVGVSCHAMLGGHTDRVAVTAMLGVGTPQAMAAEARELTDRFGIASFKVKVGLHLDQDVAALRAVRAEVPDALLNVDANHGYSGFEARRFVDQTRSLGIDIAWMEEPTDSELPVERERFRRETHMLTMGDESCPTPGAVAREGLAGRIDLVSMKVARTGYIASDQIRGFCESTGLSPVMGSQGESGLGTWSSLAYGAAHRSTAALPGEYTYYLELADDIVANVPVVVDGYLTVPDGPGTGAVIDDEKLAFYGADG
jgi:L-Ala-D/L-Glu epimerase